MLSSTETCWLKVWVIAMAASLDLRVIIGYVFRTSTKYSIRFVNGGLTPVYKGETKD